MMQPARHRTAHFGLLASTCTTFLLAGLLAGCSDYAPPTTPVRDGLAAGAPHVVIPTPGPGIDIPPASTGGRLHVPRQIVVTMAPGETPELLNLALGTITIDVAPLIDSYLLWTPANIPLDLILQQANDHQDVLVADLNYFVQSPESEQASLAFNDGQTAAEYQDQEFLARLAAGEAQQVADGSGVTVATIDTGVDMTHPRIAGSIAMNGYDFVSIDGIPQDDTDGIDQDLDGIVDEAAGHGTHVAGLVLLTAPGARILPVRVLDNEGWGTSFIVAKGILYAAENGADIINMSLGMNGHQPQIERAIRYAAEREIVLVASAGNAGRNAPDHYPAGSLNVIAVAATDSNDHVAPFSNYGQHIALCAPGTGLLSTYLNGAYATWSGTSMSAPLCSGGAALLLSFNSNMTRLSVDNILKQGSDDISSLNEPYAGKIGSGRINLRQAIDAARSR